MVLIVDSRPKECDWTVFDYNNKEVTKTRTGYLGSKNLNVFQIFTILFSANDLLDVNKK